MLQTFGNNYGKSEDTGKFTNCKCLSFLIVDTLSFSFYLSFAHLIHPTCLTYLPFLPATPPLTLLTLCITSLPLCITCLFPPSYFISLPTCLPALLSCPHVLSYPLNLTYPAQPTYIPTLFAPPNPICPTQLLT